MGSSPTRPTTQTSAPAVAGFRDGCPEAGRGAVQEPGDGQEAP
ncbi:hypothetical protein ACH4S8_11215 [Streptomyces sp. NPDC021080]